VPQPEPPDGATFIVGAADADASIRVTGNMTCGCRVRRPSEQVSS